MVTNKSRPARKFSSISSNDSIITAPIDLKCKILSPLSLNSYQSGKVGLGIVADLENSDDESQSQSVPIPVNGGDNSGGEIEEMEDGLEEYTYVTRYGPDESYTRVYYDGGRYAGDDEFNGRSCGRNCSVCLFHISPARFGSTEESPVASDFLSCCNLCRKKLDGEDVYMYRGEKAFCSSECRNSQISMDERKSKCTTTTTNNNNSRSLRISSSSPYACTKNHNRQIFSSRIIAI